MIGQPTIERSKSADLRLALGLSTVGVIFAVFLISLVQPWRPALPLSNDFISFWTGAVFVRDGHSAWLPDMDAQARFQAALRESLTGSPEIAPGVVLDPFHSPPVQGAILWPLTLLPLTWAYIFLGAVTFAGALASVALALRGGTWGKTAAVLLVGFAPLADTILFGQVNAQFVIAITLGLLAMQAGRPFLGGLVLGLLWLKPQYALLFPLVFLVKRRWAELLGVVASGALLAAISILMVGVDGAVRFVRLTSEIGAFYPPTDSFIFPQSMVNWKSVLIHLWSAVPADSGAALMLTLDVVTFGVALLGWQGSWDPRSWRFPRQMLALVTAAVITAPHSNFHGLVIVLGPVALMIATRAPTGVPLRRTMAFLLVATYVMAAAIWPVKVNSWLLVPVLLACEVALVVQVRSAAIPRVDESTPQPAG